MTASPSSWTLLLLAASGGLASGSTWTQLRAAGSAAGPSARNAHRAVLEESTGTMLLYGGKSNGAVRGDLWACELETETWTELLPSGATPEARWFPVFVLASATCTLLLHGGGQIGGIFLADFWSYSLASNAWAQLSPAGPQPSRRQGHVAVLDTEAGNLVMHGGYSGSDLDDLWSYNLAANVWSELSPSGARPGARSHHTAVFDQASRRMLIHGGWSDELWSYDLAANAWAQLTPVGAKPSGRSTHVAVLDQPTSTMWVHGGVLAADGFPTYLGDLWSYDVDANAWTQRSSAGAQPSARQEHVAVLEPTSRNIYIHDGIGSSSSAFDEFWKYGLPTTSTTSTTTTTTTCSAGWAPDFGGSCTQCAAGAFATPDSCEPCSVGHTSQPGSSACLATLEFIVAGLRAPVLASSIDGFGALDLRLELSPLPGHEAIFEDAALQYAMDVAPDASQLSGPTSPCALLWQVNEAPIAHLRHSYGQLSGPCELSAAAAPDDWLRKGTIATYVVARESGGTERVVQQWLINTTLDFSSVRDDIKSTLVSRTIVIGDQTFEVGGFPSGLALFQSEAFAEQKQFPYFSEGDIVHFEHSLRTASANLVLEIEGAWLSSSDDLTDTASIQHNLTAALVGHSAAPAHARASFNAKPCNPCYLHCISRVGNNDSSRRLAASPQHAVQSLYLEVLGRVAVAEEEMPDLILGGPIVVIILAFFIASIAACSGHFLCIASGCCRCARAARTNLKLFFILEIFDVCFDIVSLLFTWAENDLKFANDEAELVFKALIVSTAGSVLAFLAELLMLLWVWKRLSKERQHMLHMVMTYLHLAMEDTFQALIYCAVSASQAQGGLGFTFATIFALVQALGLLSFKLLDIFDFFSDRGNDAGSTSAGGEGGGSAAGTGGGGSDSRAVHPSAEKFGKPS